LASPIICLEITHLKESIIKTINRIINEDNAFPVNIYNAHYEYLARTVACNSTTLNELKKLT